MRPVTLFAPWRTRFGVALHASRGALLLLGLAASACGKDSPTGPSGTTVGPTGGTLTFAGGSVVLVFPEGAVSQRVTVSVQATTQYPANPGLVPGAVYEFQPAGLRFAAPVLLGMLYNPAGVPGGVPEGELTMGQVAGAGWTELGQTEVDPASHAVAAAIGGFSTYGVMAIPVAAVTVSPASATVLRDQTLALHATVMAAGARTLDHRAVQWSSSNPSVATVDGGGVLTSVAQGTATVTARSDQVAGTAAISVRVLDFVSVTAGGEHSCGLTTSGDAWCWGPTPLPVSGGLTFTKLDAGQEHTCGVIASGTAYCFGRGDDGQLGNGSFTSDVGFLTPVLVVGGRTWTAVSAGFVHTCGLTSDSDAYCWGNNALGTLGDGSTTSSSIPVLVAGGIKFQSVSAGAWFSCGVALDGRGYCWGYNPAGNLGDGTTQDHHVPAPIAGDLVWRAIGAGANYACGVTTDDRAYCWGANNGGALGDGTTTDRSAPTLVSGGRAFLSITADNSHTCGVVAAASAYCWGGNQLGQLGIGSTINQTAPAQVSGGLAWQSVSVSLSGVGAHTCGISSGNIVYCWGTGDRGQLGNGSFTNATHPVRVLGQR